MITLRLLATAALAATLLSGTTRAQETGTTRSFNVTKGGTLNVHLSMGSIAVQTWDKAAVEIGGRAGSGDLQHWEVEQKGGDISITDNMAEGGGDDLSVRVPRDYNVNAKTSGGDIELHGTLTGDFRGQTSGGDIQLENVGKRVDVSTAGGTVTIGDIGDGGRIYSSGGDIHIRDVGKWLDASTAGGNVAVGDVGGDMKISSSGGNVQAGKVAGSADLSTAGGDIDLRSAVGRARLSTSGGDVNAYEVTGSIEASTAGGNVNAALIPTGKGRSRLMSSGGDITLALPANAKATIDAEIRLDGTGESEAGYQIRSDFPAERQNREESSHLIHTRYLLNGGGEEITLETVNSNIYIKKLVR